MIRATIHDRAVWAYGHSGYGAKGQDIICAAVSMLMEAAAATLKAQSAPVLDIRGDGFWSLMAAEGAAPFWSGLVGGVFLSPDVSPGQQRTGGGAAGTLSSGAALWRLCGGQRSPDKEGTPCMMSRN